MPWGMSKDRSTFHLPDPNLRNIRRSCPVWDSPGSVRLFQALPNWLPVIPSPFTTFGNLRPSDGTSHKVMNFHIHAYR